MSTVNELYSLAVKSIKRKDFDKAMDYFLQILDMDPEHIDARKGLRALENNLFNKNQKFKAYITGLPILVKIFILDKRKNFVDVVKTCERYLLLDPTHVWVNACLARAAASMKFQKTARFAYEQLVDLAPSDVAIVLEAADFLSDLGLPETYEKANALIAKLIDDNPQNSDLISDQNRIAAKKTLVSYENITSSHEVLVDKKQSQNLEKEGQIIRTEEDLNEAITRALEREKADPGSARHKETVGSLLFRKGDLKGAKEYYEKSIKIDPNNNNIHALIGDVVIRSHELQIQSLEKKLASAPEGARTEVEEKLKLARNKLGQTKLKEFNRRLSVNPNDLSTHLALGELYSEANKLNEAIQHYQKAVVDPRLGYKAGTCLGLAFKKKNLFDMAITQFEEASRRSNISQNDRLSVLYEIGLCQMELKQPAKALDIFKSILERDFGYRDVAQKVEQISQSS
ncbi:MAG: tetratricopeptide repeat protein [Planctomycetes bacterium]|nr:tetratricopeptide repeat protein [Planctomycetota bacterium]